MNFILITTISLMSLLYLLIGFGINKDNAKYLLAGYNTMNQEEQDRFDIEEYLSFLKPFFKKPLFIPADNLCTLQPSPQRRYSRNSLGNYSASAFSFIY